MIGLICWLFGHTWSWQERYRDNDWKKLVAVWRECDMCGRIDFETAKRLGLGPPRRAGAEGDR